MRNILNLFKLRIGVAIAFAAAAGIAVEAGVRPSFRDGLILVLAVLVAYGDFRWANTSRQAGEELTREYGASRPMFFQGHWGFQYYAELAGARAFDPEAHVLNSGRAVYGGCRRRSNDR